MKRKILNKGFFQNFVALAIAILLIIGASMFNLSRPESLYATSCSLYNGDQSSCQNQSGCSWSDSCSIYNGDSNTCQSSGCYYPGNTGDCSAFGDASSCNSQSGCSASTYSCAWDGDLLACTGEDSGCSGYGDEFSCNGEHFANCGGAYDNGECSGVLSTGICSGNFDGDAPILQSATVNYRTLVLTYNEALNEGSGSPATGDFSITVDSVSVSADSTNISGSTAVLTLSQPALVGTVVSLTYVPGVNPIQDTSGNQVESIYDQVVTNNTVVAFSSISPNNGSTINNVTTDSDVAYTINNYDLISGNVTVTQTGGASDPNSPHVCALAGTALSLGAHTLDFSDVDNGCASYPYSLVSGSIYEFRFEGVDSQSNVVDSVSVTGITFDDTPPSAPGVPDLNQISDLGEINNDNVTNDLDPTFNISCENGATVSLLEGESHTSLGAGVCSGGTVSITSSTLSNGQYSVHALQSDAAGNLSQYSSDLLMTIDNTVPNSAGIPDPSFDGSTTSDNTPTFTASCDEDTSTVSIMSGSSVLGTAHCNGTSAAITLNMLSDGAYTIRTRHTDLAGNTNLSDSSDISFTVDATGPSITSIASTTASTTATITWNTDESATSTIDYGITSGYGTVSLSSTATTSHSYTLTGLTSATLYHFKISVWDALGNLTESLDVTFTTESAPTSPPTSPDTVPSSTGGSSGGGGGYVAYYTVNTQSTSHATSTPNHIYTTSTLPVVTLPTSKFTYPNGTAFTFNRNLTPYTFIARDALKLQILLNTLGYTVSKTGAGSPGKENNRFGPATRAALARFQNSVGITPSVGYFGPITRAYINDLIKKLVGKQ